MKKKQIELPEDTHSIFIAKDSQHAARLNSSDDLCDVLWTFLHQDLRDKLRYGHKFKTANKALEWVREELSNSLSDHNINIDSLWS